MGKKFFTADTHFGSERVRGYNRRPFENTRAMDDALVANWNRVVSKDDIVYHLGDFGNYDRIPELNGKIILILGNYEESEMKDLCENDFALYRSCLLEMGFYEVIEKGMFIALEDEKIYLTHHPLDCKREYFNLFGHIHNLCKVKEFGLNVGTDNYHYCPIPVEEVLFFKGAIKEVYNEDVFVREIN